MAARILDRESYTRTYRQGLDPFPASFLWAAVCNDELGSDCQLQRLESGKLGRTSREKIRRYDAVLFRIYRIVTRVNNIRSEPGLRGTSSMGPERAKAVA